MSCDVLKDLNIEIQTKYLYLGLKLICKCTGYVFEVSCDDLCDKLGITRARMYRARAFLVKIGAIQHSKKFCQQTGKRISDIYKIN